MTCIYAGNRQNNAQPYIYRMKCVKYLWIAHYYLVYTAGTSYYIIDFSFVFFCACYLYYKAVRIRQVSPLLLHRPRRIVRGERGDERARARQVVCGIVRHYITFWINYSFRKLVTLYIKPCVFVCRDLGLLMFKEQRLLPRRPHSQNKESIKMQALARHQCVSLRCV